MLLKFGFESNMTKQKITAQSALKFLEKYFKEDLMSIYGEICQFREGFKSFESYTANQSQIKDGGKTMTMFHQMLNFLTLKEDMHNDAIDHFSKQPVDHKKQFPFLLSDVEVQKVIFDEQYVNYIK